ncbi:LytTR family DNA-binding domain-containing protein [Fructilactobacillus vespulae]|uniref:LytTR family DNA-binding domain-containing protein n=1 Tax=Fructilactobacillus vespulae TaxID=1249630 RepID=UPI0039B47836
MKIKFTPAENLPDNQIEVEVRAAALNDEVLELLGKLKAIDSSTAIFPIKLEDKTRIVNEADIIAIEVNRPNLIFYVSGDQYISKGNLKSCLDSLNRDFIQVSKYGVININKLVSLEASFSGNMIALLANNVKINVSRRYLVDLKERLGM